ncbi:hypothetical protein D3C79_545760 [compost metagenome]
MAEQHEAGAPVRGREAGKTGPLRGLQGPHGDIQLLACHEVKGPGPGEVAKCGLKIGAAEDLAGQCHVQPAEFAIGLDLAEGGPVAPGHRQCLFGAQRQVRCEQQAEAQCAVNSGLDMFPDQAEPPCSVSWIPEYVSQGGTGPGERHHRHSAPPWWAFPPRLGGVSHFSRVTAPTPLDCASILSPLLCSPGKSLFSL